MIISQGENIDFTKETLVKFLNMKVTYFISDIKIVLPFFKFKLGPSLSTKGSRTNMVEFDVKTS